MAKKWYEKTALYTLPAWWLYNIQVDAIHIDSGLFETNTRVIDCILWISVKPRDKHGLGHSIDFGVPSYQLYGSVTRLNKMFGWAAWNNDAQSDKIFYNGNPYGMGLNTIAVEMRLSLVPLTSTIYYDVSYIMEVDI